MIPGAPTEVGDRWWPAPAKLNLMLRIVGRRADGYHLLQTVFQFVDCADRLSFSVRRDGGVGRVRPLAGVAEEDDLVVRAARLLQQHTGCPLGVDIDLDKRLPMGAGLGGGSSDAATTLAVLNRLWGTGVSDDRLASLGLVLGADVPIFLFGRAAWAEGVGEDLKPMALPEPWYLVVIPPDEVSTGAVFADPELTRDSPPLRISDFLAGAGGNDCLAVVRRRHPAVGEAMDWLGGHAKARLTGTGGAVFAAFDVPDAARGLLAQLPTKWRGFLARGLNRSPLLAMLQGASD